MAEEKKDLTGLLQYSQSLEEAGQAPPVPEGAIMEEKPIEKIDNFESLEDYALSNPPAEPSQGESIPSSEGSDPFASSTVESPPPPDPFQTDQAVTESAPSDVAQTDFPITPSDFSATPPADFSSDLAPATSSDFPSDPAPATSSDFPSDPAPTTSSDFPSDPAPATSSDFPSDPAPAPSQDFSTEPSPEISPPSEPSSSLQVVTAPPAPPKEPPSTPLEKVKRFSEKLPVGKPAVPASFPFSLMIDGHLRTEEKDRLLDLIARENMGIREIDLEPQFTSGRILIPRISEYAGVLLVQALRGARAQIKLGPSDTIFATEDTRSDPQESHNESLDEKNSTYSADNSHPAELIPITSDNKLPDLLQFTVIDTLSASATLKATVIEAESSSEYLEIVDALQREIKYKAYRKGAQGIVNFKIQLSQLSSPTHYRILVMGTAIKSPLIH